MVPKLNKRNKTTSKKFDDDAMLANCDVIVIFLNYGHFGAFQKPDSGRTVCKTYIFINSNLLSYKSLTQLSHIALSKGTIFAKKRSFFPKNVDISKIKSALRLQGMFSETKYVCVLTYQISSF